MPVHTASVAERRQACNGSVSANRRGILVASHMGIHISRQFAALSPTKICCSQPAPPCRAWREVMRWEAIDLELPHRATPEHSTWLSRTRVQVRSIRFPLSGISVFDRAMGPHPTSATLTLLTDVLASSTRTLEVRCRFNTQA